MINSQQADGNEPEMNPGLLAKRPFQALRKQLLSEPSLVTLQYWQLGVVRHNSMHPEVPETGMPSEVFFRSRLPPINTELSAYMHSVTRGEDPQ